MVTAEELVPNQTASAARPSWRWRKHGFCGHAYNDHHQYLLTPCCPETHRGKLWLKFADFRAAIEQAGARSTPWMKQGCSRMVLRSWSFWADCLRFVVWPPCLGQRTALRHPVMRFERG